jgi:hypothetical protein
MLKNKKLHLADATMMVNTDQLMRQPVEGVVSPTKFPELTEYLASSLGEIRYHFEGKCLIDQLGRQKRQVKCIILGWFEVKDVLTLLPSRFICDIQNVLVLVASEEELPPLQDEQDDEDYVITGSEFNVWASIQEEILLALPINTPRTSSQIVKDKPQQQVKSVMNQARPSPFAKLAALKKSG